MKCYEWGQVLTDLLFPDTESKNPIKKSISSYVFVPLKHYSTINIEVQD
jgi:hypothetical protein